MTDDMYFVIRNRNGTTRISKLVERELLALLRDEYWGGDAAFWTPQAFLGCAKDPDYWDGRILIIKGTVVTVTPPGDWKLE